MRHTLLLAGRLRLNSTWSPPPSWPTTAGYTRQSPSRPAITRTARTIRHFATSRAASQTPSSHPSIPSSSSPSGSGSSRMGRWGRRAAIFLVAGGVVYVVDREFNASALSRSVRTGYTAVLCTLDYKINFQPDKANEIEQLHQRVADRLRWVIDTNQGLYLKMGQALGLQAGMLPKPYREAFAHVFDRAPSVSYDQIENVFKADIGQLPTDIFETFTPEAMASASIAQVHKATLKVDEGSNGGSKPLAVAVKVQKPAIRKQMASDLFSYRSVMWLAQKAFDLPMYFVAKYVSSQMVNEADFLREASNARKCAEFLAETPELADNVYVPRVFGKDEGYPESKRILVMEWVDGCRLNDKDKLEEWGLDLAEVMDLAISLNGAMTFKWGFVHCDPHPGNILVRPHPRKPGKPQLLILDHGLYVTLSPTFRDEYATLWRSIFVHDYSKVEELSRKWGLGFDANMLASATILRPSRIKEQVGPEEVHGVNQYEIQLQLKQQLKSMLENEQKIPKEIIFLGRCQRMLQVNNQNLGSPSARVNITARWAAKGYAAMQLRHTGPRTLASVGLRSWMRDQWQAAMFRVTLLFIDLAFWWTRFKQQWITHEKSGWEDKLQQRMNEMARSELGIEIDDSMYFG